MFAFEASATSAAAAAEIAATAGTAATPMTAATTAILMNGDQIRELITGLMGPLTVLVKTTIQQTTASTEKVSSEDVPDKKEKGYDSRLTEKSYKRMEKFSGGETEWDEWKYDFMIITRSVNSEVGAALETCIKGKKPVDAITLQGCVDDTHQPGEVKSWDPTKRWKELFELLIMLTAGEGKSLI